MRIDEPTLRQAISKNIASYRKAAGITQQALAAKLNYSDKSVSKWERGESLPDIYILSQLADLYGVTVSNLIGEVEPPKEAKPHYHLFILALAVALAFAVAVILFVIFKIADIPFHAWLFFIYAIPVAAILGIVFTCLWWSIFWQALSISVLIWSMGLSIFLSIPLRNRSLIFVVCAAMQVLTILWELFQKFRQRTKKHD